MLALYVLYRTTHRGILEKPVVAQLCVNHVVRIVFLNFKMLSNFARKHILNVRAVSLVFITVYFCGSSSNEVHETRL